MLMKIVQATGASVVKEGWGGGGKEGGKKKISRKHMSKSNSKIKIYLFLVQAGS